jgi:hypothetical protein
VLVNDGTGRFTIAQPGSILPATATGNGFDVEIADFNGDGANDLFLCNRASRTQNPQTAAATGGRQRLLFARPR